MKVNKYLLSVILVFCCIILININMLNGINKGTKEDDLAKQNSLNLKESPGAEKQINKKPYNMRKWKETDPKEVEKYGITLTSSVTEPSSAEEWKWYLEQNLRQNKVLESEARKEVVKTMQTTSEDYEKKINKIDEHIAIVKKWQEEQPSDTKIEEQLQNLYKIRAVGTVLKDRVVTSDVTPQVQEDEALKHESEF